MKTSRLLLATGLFALCAGVLLSARAARADGAFDKAKWIWFDEGDPVAEAPAATRYFLRAFTVENKTVKAATLTITCDNKYEAWLNGKQVGTGEDWQKAQAYDVKEALAKGDNVLAVAGTNEDGPAGLIAVLKIEFEAGDPQYVATDKDWKAHNEKADGWEKPGFDAKDFKLVKVIGDYGMDPWGNQIEMP